MDDRSFDLVLEVIQNILWYFLSPVVSWCKMCKWSWETSYGTVWL